MPNGFCTGMPNASDVNEILSSETDYYNYIIFVAFGSKDPEG